VRPDFTVTNANAPAVAAICARLDGLPLAIELAAARVKLFAPDAILARLEKRLSLLTGGARDLPARQQTLRGAIDWSHNLLDDAERGLFRRLSIFSGGWTFDAAEAICDPDGELGLDVADGLISFVDKSLVRRDEMPDGEPRFRMLETIREYARERLTEHAEGDIVARRHGTFFADLVLRAEPELLGADQAIWLDRLETERDNVRAALHWAVDAGEVELALRAAGSLWRFWHQRAHLAEGREVLESILRRPEASGATPGRGLALAGLGGIVYWQGRFDDARAIYADALTVYRALDDAAGLADAIYNLGFVEMITHHLDVANPLLIESLAIYERLRDDTGVIKVREALAFSMYLIGEYGQALEIEEALVRALQGRGEPFRLSNALVLTSLLRIANGRPADAHETLADAMAILRTAGDIATAVNCLQVAAHGLLQEGRPEAAAVLAGAVDAIRAPLGELATGLDILSIEDPAIGARRALGDAAYEAAYARGRGLDLAGAMTFALAADGDAESAAAPAPA
jgi:tetratricopeptide (TPR) repeat protein